MSITVKELYKKGSDKYEMKLIAGKDGVENLVQWVHIIEDSDVSDFLHGQELVFTAGIMSNQKGWMLDFVKKLHEAGVSAFVINIGPHIRIVEKEVIEFCDEVKMPLFTIPWRTRMVDVTRDICNRIIRNETVEDTLATTIKNIIFHVGDIETQILQMERYGYDRKGRFCFCAITMNKDEKVFIEKNWAQLKKVTEKVARNIKELYLAFTFREYLIVVLTEYSQNEIVKFVDDLKAVVSSGGYNWGLHIGVSCNICDISCQNDNFDKAIAAVGLAIRKQKTDVYYDELGVYKILFEVKDQELIRSYYDESVGIIEKYDLKKDTSLVEFLKTYFECNQSQQQVSEKLFIHRNTVNKQLKKIESITGYSFDRFDDKVKLYLALLIKDVV